MTAQSKPYPAVQLLIDTFAGWLKHRRELSELRQMHRADFDRIADDLRVSPSELDASVRRVLEIKRGGQQQSIQLKLGTRPQSASQSQNGG